MILSAPLSPALGLGGPVLSQAAASPSPNPNLLLWSEEMQQASWTISAGTVLVVADAGESPAGGIVADDLVFGAEGSEIGQSTGVAATSGSAATLMVSLSPGSWPARISLSGTFDDTPYRLSCWLQEPVGGGSEIELRLERSGGVLRVNLRDVGYSPTVRAWGWKLETPDLTDYVKREGA